GADAIKVWELGRSFSEQLHAALADDFNTSKALALLFSLARAVNRLGAHKKAKKRGGPVVAAALEAFTLVGKTMGLMTTPTQDFLEEVKDKRLASMGISRAEVEALVAERVAKREAKEWAEADQLRDALLAKSIVVMDGPEGSRWKVRLESPDADDAAAG
ncbi:MAG: DALR domain-containing protein, partial [Myxococcota bacterium]